jgi:hypothetical protein
MHLSEETQDGLMLEWALSRSTTLRDRRRIYEAKLKADRKAIEHKSKDELIAALKAYMPSYIEELLQKNDISQLRDRVVHSLRSSYSQPLRDILQIQQPEIM